MEMKKKLRPISFEGYLKVSIKRHEQLYGELNEDSIVDIRNRNPEQVATALWGEIICRFYNQHIWN